MKRILFLLLITPFCICSCVDEDDFKLDNLAQTTLNPTLDLGNIISVDVKLSDFLKIDIDSLVASVDGLKLELLSDEGGDYLNLNYHRMDTLIPDGMVDIIPILNTDFQIPTLQIPFTGIIPDTIDIKYPNNGTMLAEKIIIPSLGDSIRFDSVTFMNNSKLRLTFDNNLTDIQGINIKLVLQSSYIRNKYNGHLFCDTITLIGSNQTNAFDLDLSDYRIAFDASSIDTLSFAFEYAFLLHALPGASLLSNMDFGIHLISENLAIDVAYGYVGHYNFNSYDTVDIPYFDDTSYASIFTPGSIDLERFKATMSAYTNIGIQTTIYLKELASSNSAGLYSTLVDDSPNDTILDHNGAVIPHQSIEIPLNPLQSNLSGMETMPNKIFSAIVMEFNKDRPENFITPQDAYVAIKSDMQVPLKLKVNNLTYTSDVAAFKVVSELDYLKSTTLVFTIDNGFPASIDAQLYLCDSNNNIIDSLLPNSQFIIGADVNDYGQVVASKTNKVNIELTQKTYESLRHSSKIRIKLILNTSSNANGKPFVRLRHDDPYQILRMSIGVKAKANITI
ncbi:MAG: hypothetical protein LBL74_08150 [Bacteroidales bacterium]|jgi:hypothetical protein|nr:hypothetical protein [Bacteroidales bacterium]